MEICVKEFSLFRKNRNNKIPLAKNFHNDDKKLNSDLENNLNNLIKFIDKQDLNDYIKKVIKFSFDANKYFNDQEPGKRKNNISRMNAIMHTITKQIKNISILLFL